MFSKIWRGFAQAPAIAGCRRSLRENDLASARLYYAKFQGSLVPRHLAMGARLHMLEGNSAEAKLLLEKALDVASGKTGRNDRYVVEYCRYFLSLIAKDDQHEAYRIKALALNPSGVFFDSLPLPSMDVTRMPASSNALH